MTKADVGKGLLKIYRFFAILSFLLVLVVAILSFVKPDFEYIKELLKDIDIGNLNPGTVAGVAFSIIAVIQLIEVWLLSRAINNPRKSVFLLIISILSLIGDIVTLVKVGINSANIISLIWSVALFFGIVFVRSGIEEN